MILINTAAISMLNIIKRDIKELNNIEIINLINNASESENRRIDES